MRKFNIFLKSWKINRLSFVRYNKWFSPEVWGEPMMAIDFAGNETLLQDNRINIIYKQQYPNLCKEYVLWRVEHDGSCWVSTGITKLIYHMIESGPDKFDEATNYFKRLFASDPGYSNKENQQIARNLFSILKLIRKEMDHNFSLALRNHRNVYEALDAGFRKILSLYWEKYDHAKSTQINTAFSLGYAADFKGLFNEIGFKYAEFLTDGECDGAPATMSYFDLAAYIGDQELNSLTQNCLNKKMPPIMAFLSTPGFMDIAVKKDLSDQINTKIGAQKNAHKANLLNKLLNYGSSFVRC